MTSNDWMIWGAVCIFAILMGIFLAKKQTSRFRGKHQDGRFPPVTFTDYGDMRFLHLGSPAVQGSMKRSSPYEIHLEYVQRMMAWLLFTDLNNVSRLHAMQLGLGAASLTKFCHHYLCTQTTAIELNPEVITSCRQSFALPADGPRLQVVLGDAATTIQDEKWHQQIDALHVDLYDQEAERPVLDSPAFYRDCYQLLTDNGCMTVNVFGKASNVTQSVKHISAAFGKDAVWLFKPTPAGNTIVLALRQACQIEPHALHAQAQLIEARWPLPATKWLKVLAPVSST